jgi:hypothetical protein
MFLPCLNSCLAPQSPGEAFSLVAAADCLLENGKVPTIVAPLSTTKNAKTTVCEVSSMSTSDNVTALAIKA